MVERLCRSFRRTLVLVGSVGVGHGRRGELGETETRQLSPPGRYGDKMV